MAEILIKGLIGLALVLAYLGFAFTIAFVFGRAAASSNDVYLNPMVSERPGDQPDLPACMAPNDEALYAQVERFDDPEGDL